MLSVEGDARAGVAHRAGALSDYAVSVGDGVDYRGDGGSDEAAKQATPNGAFRSGQGQCFGFDPDVRFNGSYKSVISLKLNSRSSEPVEPYSLTSSGMPRA